MLEETYKLVVDFSIKGDLAYLSHQETLTMFRRAMIRASVPLVFSKGFNPHPCLSLPFPRSVGTQTDSDRICALVQFSTEKPPAEELREAIQHQLDADCCVHEVRYNDRKSSYQPESVCYVFQLEHPLDKQSQNHLRRCRKQIDENEIIEIRRYWAKKKRYIKLDIAPYLKGLAFSEDRIEILCRVSPSGTVRVDEMMNWLNITPENLREPVSRTEINWSQN